MMPLPNRVFPCGAIRAVSSRGRLLGNRGGRFHRDNQTLKPREWASKQWIFCVLEFKNRHREVMTKGYTELFFCDEFSSLAAGHRPCFECQREKAKNFAHYFALGQGLEQPLKAPQMDEILHTERFKTYAMQDDLPNGAMGQSGAQYFVQLNNLWHAWSFEGYQTTHETPDVLLTPPSILKTLKAGYKPEMHHL